MKKKYSYLLFVNWTIGSSEESQRKITPICTQSTLMVTVGAIKNVENLENLKKTIMDEIDSYNYIVNSVRGDYLNDVSLEIQDVHILAFSKFEG
jgi:hypothetical protein